MTHNMIPDNFEILAQHLYATEIAAKCGVTSECVYRWAKRRGVALLAAPRGGAAQYREVVRRPEAKSWCEQCERRVSAGEATACRSQWCKARSVA